jgi:hypothetical protein
VARSFKYAGKTRDLLRSNFRRHIPNLIVTIVFTAITLIPIGMSIAYRWSLKSTAALWLPLIWIVIQARPGTQVIARLVVMTRSAWAKTMLAYSALVLLAFLAKLALLLGIWHLANLDWLGPLGVAASRLAAPFQLPLWQIAGALNALLAWLFFFQADRHILVPSRPTHSREWHHRGMAGTLGPP